MNKKTFFCLTDAEKKSGREYLRWNKLDIKRPIIGIHPGASWPAKMWPKKRFAELADMFVESGRQVVIFSGPKDRPVGAEVCLLMRNKVPFADALPLREFAGIVSNLDCFITNDNGPLHVAAALSTPLVGIFGPGDPSVWFPYSKKAKFLKKPVKCWPCGRDHCEKLECMSAIKPAEVFKAVAALSGKKGKARK